MAQQNIIVYSVQSSQHTPTYPLRWLDGTQN